MGTQPVMIYTRKEGGEHKRTYGRHKSADRRHETTPQRWSVAKKKNYKEIQLQCTHVL